MKTKSKEAVGFEPCYMVFIEGSYAPNKRHSDLGSAMTEAERLSRKENKRAYVLADVYKCEPISPPVVWSQSAFKNTKNKGQ